MCLPRKSSGLVAHLVETSRDRREAKAAVERRQRYRQGRDRRIDQRLTASLRLLGRALLSQVLNEHDQLNEHITVVPISGHGTAEQGPR
jgi:hypothetical protein